MLIPVSYPVRVAAGPPLALAMGTFDGVHRGHKAVLHTAVALAKAHPGSIAAAWTFDPPPDQVVGRERKEPLVPELSEKVELLQAQGMQRVYALQFDAQVAALSPRAFVEDLLLQFPLIGIAVGFNFGFGSQRSGKARDLPEWLPPRVAVQIVPPVACDGEVISSSRVRRLLARGEVQQAGHLLGRPYRTTGRVVEGEQRGRHLGFPTANLMTHHPELRYGVYAVEVRLLDGSCWPALLNWGKRPSFAGQEARMEAHLLGFEGDLYGKTLRIDWLAFIREEKFFSSSSALVAQITQDIKDAKAIFSPPPNLHLSMGYRTMSAVHRAWHGASR